MARITRSTGAGTPAEDKPASKSVSKKPAAKKATKKAAAKKAEKVLLDAAAKAVEEVTAVEEEKAAAPVDTSLRVVTRSGARHGEVVKLIGMLNGGKAVCADKNGARFKIHVNNLGPVEDK